MKQTIWTLLWRRFSNRNGRLVGCSSRLRILISVIVVPVLKGLLYVGQPSDEVPFICPLSNVERS